MPVTRAGTFVSQFNIDRQIFCGIKNLFDLRYKLTVQYLLERSLFGCPRRQIGDGCPTATTNVEKNVHTHTYFS